MMKYDVTVIGSGPGGYVAAIRCAQLGMKTAIIERYSTLGGSCLNVGCIPSKALLDSSEHYHQARNSFAIHGIEFSGLKADFSQMMKRKDDVVRQTCEGVGYLMRKNKIVVHQGHGSFVDANTIEIANADGSKETIETRKTIIASGSKPSTTPGVEIDKKRIITSTEALTLQDVPGEILVIGAGAIGLELGQVYARLGTKVQVIEYLNGILPTMDRALGKELQRILKKMGIVFHLDHRVKRVEAHSKKVLLQADNKKGEEVSFNGDYCLVAVGRRPYTDKLGLENIGIRTEKGSIPVNDQLETSVPGVYAIGDVIRGAMLAHKAEEEGIYVAEIMAGQKPHINYRAIPSVVYTWPEVAGGGVH